MSDKVTLMVEDRQIQGKAVKSLRKEGFIPAVVYGQGVEAHNIMVNLAVMTKLYRLAGKHRPIELINNNVKQLAMIKAADFDPIKRTLRHIAFQVIKQNEKVETEVPIVIRGEGETPAERAGLVVLTALETVEVAALPAKLPDSVEVLGEVLSAVGDRVTVADITVPDGVEILTNPEQVIATVYEPSALAAQNEALAGEAEEETVPAANEQGSSETEKADNEVA